MNRLKLNKKKSMESRMYEEFVEKAMQKMLSKISQRQVGYSLGLYGYKR